ncbi:MAG: phenylacetate-CoA oxygenase subunit PaaC [Propionibacteriales bacterium]|nr:phenylacetate-CoA oxygenase subunit PaaC [Propionibacteriales bacterium]
MVSTSEPVGIAGAAVTDVAHYAIALGDDALIASQRLTEWITLAPQLEEDVALGNIALDLLGQARLLFQYAGSLLDPPVGEDDLAYFRDERAFRNVSLVERPNGDFAVTMARLLVFSAYQLELYSRLVQSTDSTLAAIAAKAVKEVAYHRDHARQWVLRLGDGTAESHARMQTALDAEWPWTAELFEAGWLAPELVAGGLAVDPAALAQPALAWVRAVVAEATLAEPEVRPAVSFGRVGRHTEEMGRLLAELQHLARSHPGATW